MNVENSPVGERLQRDYGLKVLRICMDSSSSQVLLSISAGHGEELALLTVPAQELGLPDEAAASAEGDGSLSEGQFRIPDYLRGALRSAVLSSEPEDAPLWLSLVRPIGLLAAVPWERLLHPLLHVPILRLPNHLISPRALRRTLDSVICFSSPVATPELERDLIDQFIEQVPVGLAQRTTLHLFADAAVYDKLRAIQRQYESSFRIEVYRPPPRDQLRGRLPWLSWMQESLHGQTADVVHFLCHCYRVREQGALALAEAPDRNQNTDEASLVFAPDLVEFLDTLGAWSVAFSSPPTNASAAGMRMLQDQVARLRPGPIFLHDMSHPDAKEGLAATYGFLYGEGFAPPNTAAVSLFTHPFHGADVRTDDANERLLHDYTLIGHLGDQVNGLGQPTWLATSQRILEATAGEVAAAVEEDPDSGRKRGRDLVLAALADCARNGYTDSEERG